IAPGSFRGIEKKKREIKAFAENCCWKEQAAGPQPAKPNQQSRQTQPAKPANPASKARQTQPARPASLARQQAQ
ncbi:hypothetical protein FCV25MIE_19122, partial [Fagus crenata]